MNRKLLAYELTGALFIIILGTMLHFTFKWSGNNPLVAVFSADNESVWEHLKLVFWPTLLYALIEFVPLRGKANNFVFAKTAELYLMIALIPTIFYTYTAFIGESLAIDIGSFMVVAVVGQLFSYKLLTVRQFPRWVTWVSLFFFALLLVLFVVFTFYPPHFQLFFDPESGAYGLPPQVVVQ
jgi:hypothetical protein